MSKVTSKLQVTLPKALAERYDIRPGDDIDWIATGDSIRVTKTSTRKAPLDPTRRLELFNKATERQKRRQRTSGSGQKTSNRGWSREDLYVRGRTH